MSDARCPRSGDLIARLVDDRLTGDDRAHAASCQSCGPVLARAATFDEELRRSARSLVVDELPAGILAPSLGAQLVHAGGSRRAAPGFAAILAAIAILLVATAVALAPGSSPPATPSPEAASPSSSRLPLEETFETTTVIRGRLAKLGYGCNDGAPLTTIGPGPDAVVKDAAVCTAPESIGPLIAAVIVGESARGQVVELVIKADIMGSDTTENRAMVAEVVAKAFTVAVLDEVAGQAGGSWARVHVPQLEVGDAIDVQLHEVRFHAARLATGSYLIVATGAAAS